jgi:hypothetical protein
MAQRPSLWNLVVMLADVLDGTRISAQHTRAVIDAEITFLLIDLDVLLHMESLKSLEELLLDSGIGRSGRAGTHDGSGEIGESLFET